MFYHVNAQEPGGPKAANTTFINGNQVLKVKNGRMRVRRNFDESAGIFVDKCKNARNGQGIISTTQSLPFANVAVARVLLDVAKPEKHESR